MENNYELKGKIRVLKCTSRASIKHRDNFYTLEYGEEVSLPEDIEVDIAKEREALWERCNAEVDNQIDEIIHL